MVALAVLLVFSWFNSGGAALDWVKTTSMNIIGYTMYLLPLLLVFLAVSTFKNEENKVPIVVTVAAVLMLIWFSGIFGLAKDHTGDPTGGSLGKLVNFGMLSVASPTVAGFLYILLIFITLLFLLSISPLSVIRKISGSLKSKRVDKENDHNVRIMKKAAESETGNGLAPDFKLNAGVPMEDTEGKPKKKSIFSKPAEDKLDEAKSEKAQTTAFVTVNDPNWRMPDLSLLEKKQSPADAGNIQQNAQTIKDTLNEFGIEVEMEGANVGPRVTQYTLSPPSGVKLTKISSLDSEIMRNLAVDKLRIEAPIPGSRSVGIEVPNVKSADVRLHSVLDSKQWKNTSDPLTFAVGKDVFGNSVVANLAKMPHLLVAGTTGSGKSVMTNTIITSLLYRNSPSDMKLILVDPKQVEMTQYNDIPHLLTPIITQPEKVLSALKWAVSEMERRYTLLSEEKVKNIIGYNSKIDEIMKNPPEDLDPDFDGSKMPYVVIVIDEMADLMMMIGRDLETLIVRVAQKGRAAGIHLVLATQRPEAKIVTGLIKANIPAKIAFAVNNQIDSRVMLDQKGAEQLLGQGDMLFLTTEMMGKPKRIQGAWVSDPEIDRVANYLREQSPPQYNDEVIAQPVQLDGRGGVVMDFDGDDSDPIYQDALRLALDTGKISTSMIQTRLRIGYGRANRIIAQMEDRGIVGPSPGGAKPREVLISDLSELG